MFFSGKIFFLRCLTSFYNLGIKKTSFYDNQKPNKIIYLVEPQIIDDKKYIVSLFFRDGKIYSFSLLNIDFDFTVETEKR